MAEIREVKKDSINYYFANNLMLGMMRGLGNDVKLDTFPFRYKNQAGKVYEDTVVPYFTENQDEKLLKDHKDAVHELWFVLKERLGKAKPHEDINIFQMMNLPQFKGRVRLQTESPQYRFSLASEITFKIDSIADKLENLGYIKEALDLDIFSNMFDKWKGNQATLFFDEIQNREMDPQDAIKILNAYISSDRKLDFVAKKSGMEPVICLEVIKLARNFGLI